MTEFSELRFLLVDDSVVIRRSVSMLLRSMGLQFIEVAEDGAVALAMLKAGEAKFDLVITDINMPNTNGFGLLQAIKADDSLKHLPVLMMTLDPRTEDQVYGEECGAVGLIAKPFTRTCLEVLIRQVLGNPETTV